MTSTPGAAGQRFRHPVRRTDEEQRCISQRRVYIAADTLGHGDTIHVVPFRSGGDAVRFTVVPDRQLVFTYDDADAATLDRVGCSIDGKPLNEDTGS